MLSDSDVLNAALGLTRAHGLDALTVQSVASQLGVSAPAIYHWISNRDALKDLVVAHVIGTTELDLPSTGAPLERLRQVLLATRQTLRAYPGVAQHWLAQEHPPREGLRTIDTMLGLLIEVGLTPRDAVRAYTALYTYTMGHLLLPSPDASVRLSASHPSTENADEFPALSAVYAELLDLDAEDEFMHGLDLLFGALEPRRSVDKES